MSRKADVLVLEHLDELGRGKALQGRDERFPETADVLVNACRLEEAFADQSATMFRIALVNAAVAALEELHDEAKEQGEGNVSKGYFRPVHPEDVGASLLDFAGDLDSEAALELAGREFLFFLRREDDFERFLGELFQGGGNIYFEGVFFVELSREDVELLQEQEVGLV